MDVICWVDIFKMYALAFLISMGSVWVFVGVVCFKYEEEVARFLLKIIKKYDTTT